MGYHRDVTKQFPAHLQRLRMARRLSQLELALRADTTQRHLSFVVRHHGVLVTANRAFDVFNEGVDPALLAPPANMFRHALHPTGLAPRVLMRSPDPALEELLAELEAFLPADEATADVLRIRGERW